MAFRITTLAFALLCLFLLTEARKFDFLPSTDDGSCHYVGKCANETATEDCMTQCANNGFTSGGANCRTSVTASTCCCFKGKKSTANPSDDDQSCHYLDGCADSNECTTKCNDGGFEGKFTPAVTSINCCCL